MDFVCLSHLRWDFVYQRPQHLLGRCAKQHRVFFIEEALFEDIPEPRLDISPRKEGVLVVVPRIPQGIAGLELNEVLRKLTDKLLLAYGIRDHVLWYYTPMAMGFTDHLAPLAIVYDCMDELANFKGAPPELRLREQVLFERADLVFTGGQTLFETKRKQHSNVHAFPSSIDVKHFAQARVQQPDPADQAKIPHPRVGFYGVVDERFDLQLVQGIAELRPAWHIVILGPVAKIDRAELPQAPNIHYLGGKSYDELPKYLAGWDIAALFFARNEATKYISPTKTPEYLAGGKPVVSTSITDVVSPYGKLGLVEIADTPEEFALAVERALVNADHRWLARVDEFLATNSWDQTWSRMSGLIEATIREQQLNRREAGLLRTRKQHEIEREHPLATARS